jgi:hypothetical protein
LSSIFHRSILWRRRLVWIFGPTGRTALTVSKLNHETSGLPVDDRFIATRIIPFVIALKIIFILIPIVPFIPTVIGASFGLIVLIETITRVAVGMS